MLGDRVVGRLGEWLGPQRAGAGSSTAFPIIRVDGRALHGVTADALTALVAANDPPELFVRFGNLA